MTHQFAIARRSARAILIDDSDRLLLIKRTKDSDSSVVAALHRELSEELGAEVTSASQVFLFSTPTDAGVSVQHFFVARLARLDESARTGPEFSDPSRGGYQLDRVDLHGDALASVALKPAELKTFILANRQALLAEAAGTG